MFALNLIPVLVIYLSLHLSTFLSPLNCLDNISQEHSIFLLIADPQIDGIFKLSKGILDFFDLYVNDFSISLIYKLAYLRYDPDFVIILGDLFGNQHLSDDEFKWRLSRYEKMLPAFGNQNYYNLSGNHDIGYGSDMSLWMVERYEKYFGKTNFITKNEQFELIFLNSMSLDGSRDKVFNKMAWDFVSTLGPANKTRLLFIHIPLHPSEVLECEDDLYRETEGFYYFQNYLSKNTSTRLVDLVKPDFVISGHNHDGCLNQIYRNPYYTEEMTEREVRGKIRKNKIYGLTVRSIMGMYDGGFAILSIKGNDFHYKECTTANFIVVRVFLILDLVIFGVLMYFLKKIRFKADSGSLMTGI
eukprot:NODE_138_length_16264_cov_1.140860.p7 type:complete len:358 gc:universal NODE_138_length_16264_cov_1.140860:3545-2472(-)